MPKTALLKPIDTDIWVAEDPFVLGPSGLDVGCRATVIRLLGNKLLIHSPIKLNVELCSQIDALGEVAFLVAPNNWHHLFISYFIEAYPTAKVLGPPAIAAKRKDLSIETDFSKYDNLIKPNLQYHRVECSKFLDEVVFFHSKSRTLILTDISFNVPKPSGLMKGLFWEFAGLGKLGPSNFGKLLVRNKNEWQQFLAVLKDWDYHRVIMSHGTIAYPIDRQVFEQSLRKLV